MSVLARELAADMLATCPLGAAKDNGVISL
jgi:hypothetical protein